MCREFESDVIEGPFCRLEDGVNDLETDEPVDVVSESEFKLIDEEPDSLDLVEVVVSEVDEFDEEFDGSRLDVTEETILEADAEDEMLTD